MSFLEHWKCVWTEFRRKTQKGAFEQNFNELDFEQNFDELYLTKSSGSNKILETHVQTKFT